LGLARGRQGLTAGLALGLLLGAGPAGSQPAPSAPAPAGDAESRGIVLDRVVAVVNDEAVTLSEVQEEGQPVIRKIVQDYLGSERERRVVEAEKKILDDLIDRRLMLQVAKREGTTPSPAEVRTAIDELKKNNNAPTDEEFRALLRAEGLTMEQVQRTVTERLAIGRMLARQVRSSIIVDEDELKRYYATHEDEFRREPEAEIRHILIVPRPGESEAAAQARAEAALDKIRAGADFDAVAREFSEGGGGADTITVKRGELAPAIETVAFGLSPGSVSSVIRMESSWHIIRVDRQQSEPVAPYAEVRDAIRERVFEEKFAVKRKEWLARMRGQSYIQIVMPAAGQMLGGQAQ
jgi:peptidyl-prolyl cis-trans isomerase SurA